MVQPFNYLNVPILYITRNHESKDPFLTVIKENTDYIGNSVYEKWDWRYRWINWA